MPRRATAGNPRMPGPPSSSLPPWLAPDDAKGRSSAPEVLILARIRETAVAVDIAGASGYLRARAGDTLDSDRPRLPTGPDDASPSDGARASGGDTTRAADGEGVDE